MTVRSLNPLQVAALLVSASYGIGFLFGSGEMALRHGMAGSVYGLATAAGMLLLALCAPRLWTAGVPIWDLIGAHCGMGLRRVVAMLSVVWMAGVLAAQIRGGLAVAGLLGLPPPLAWGLILLLVYAASRVGLGIAAAVFGLCLLASGLVLVYALLAFDGLELYLEAVPRFVADLGSFDAGQLMATVLAVAILACTGADYQQFVVAARTSRAATVGCVLAAIGLVFVGFLPAAVVLSAGSSVSGDAVAGTAQVVPQVLEVAASRLGPGAGVVMLVCLSAAALGCGAAILRAMTQALGTAVGGSHRPALIALAIGAGLAARGQGIVETMVSVNVIYIASIAVVLIGLLRGQEMSEGRARVVIGVGFTSSFALYLARWTEVLPLTSDLWSLVVGLSVSAAAGGLCGLTSRRIWSLHRIVPSGDRSEARSSRPGGTGIRVR